MEQQSENIQFTARHHALLFVCVAKSVIKETGEETGGILIRKAVRKYGEQRGKRMALRAQKYGYDLTMDNYLAFGEWEVPKNDMDFKLTEKNPHARLIVYKCPWHETWEENDLLDYGQYFCKEIDTALVRGFNPSLVLEVNSTQTNDKKPCDFLFKDAGLSFFKMLGLAYKKKIRPGRKVIKPWEYHTGHLYKTMGEVIRQELGDKTGKIMEDALNNFAIYFNEKCIAVIKKYKSTDFERI
ncbi:MAG: L-2-amino-thiazoline-4-carboxylic acid hydrolase [Desulfobacteraceae bacterium]|nr:L-2-amino-thiazoline-4-carboxylic acid hydrolase [Desulfobacteraceae bacterium]